MTEESDIDSSSEPIDEAEPENVLREQALVEMHAIKWRVLRNLAIYEGNPRMAIDCMILAHGWGEMVGMNSASEVAAKYFPNTKDEQGIEKHRETVAKCIRKFQKAIGIPPAVGQRDAKGCDKMRESRKGQLKNAK